MLKRSEKQNTILIKQKLNNISNWKICAKGCSGLQANYSISHSHLSQTFLFTNQAFVWEVKDKTTGKHIGLWYFDAYARPGKRSGAWMNAYRSQQRMDGEITTIVSNNSNFVVGKPGEPVLISWEDATTLFHEFGHALHGLSSNVTYPLLSGTNVVRDYVEFPSQLLEHWLSTKKCCLNLLFIIKPKSDSGCFGWSHSESFYIQQRFYYCWIFVKRTGRHEIAPCWCQYNWRGCFRKKVRSLSWACRKKLWCVTTPQFGHVFSSDGYSAGYYSYDVLTADAFSAFTEAGGPTTKAVAKRLPG